ncbi:(R)-mandelonitrile lyase [Oceaniglobus roseus]|uniref:(R)-mandelonitrile lyase n=1 Tax=Oceaniglobus roseus TaxID=1737570 RepID=UPI000C7F6C7C|nr:cupin domain-containing protein [Kandeliimicrobium roseum]
MQIRTITDQPSAEGPAEYFTGRVRLENAFSFPEPGRTNAALVIFEPGARTAWHTHPYGQLLYVVSGEGWVRSEGGAKRAIRAGDTVFFEPGERHWHGATATRAMSHVAVQERKDGSPVDWLEQVSNVDYLAD